MVDLKEVVFSMNNQSAAGPDGMNGYFFTNMLALINTYLMELIKSFFSSEEIPCYFSHSFIVLYPRWVAQKNECVQAYYPKQIF